MSDESDAERLVVLLEARIRDFEKNMQKASGTSGNTYSRIRRDSRSATAAMEADMLRSTNRINQALAATSASIGAFGRTLPMALAGAAGIAGMLSVAGAIGTVQSAVRDLAKMSDDAKRSGLGVETFQQLKFAAEQSRIGVDTLASGMRELRLRADEFAITGKGSAAEAFKALGMSPAEVQERLKDPAELLNEIMNRVGKLNQTSRMRILDELFGGGAGEQFIKLLDHGRDGVNRLGKEARETGNVLDKDVIAKAEEIDRRFNKLATTIGTNVKGAIMQMVDGLDRLIKMLPGGEVPIERIGERSAEITREIMRTEGLLAEARANWERTGTAYHERRVQALERVIERLKAEDTLLKQRGADAVADRDQKDAFKTPGTGDYGGSTAITAARALTGFDRATQTMQKQIELLHAEATTIDMNAAARARARAVIELETAARQANKEAGKENIEITAEQREKINQLADAYANAKGKLDALNGPLATFARESADIGRQLETVTVSALDRMGDEFVDIMNGTKSVADAFRSMTVSILNDLAKIMIKRAILGPIAGIFGGGSFNSFSNLFPGGSGGAESWGFAGGGFTGHGDRHEPAGVVHRGEYVFSQPAVQRIGVENLERLHRGYANGGYVDRPRANLAQRPTSRGETSKPVQIINNVEVINKACDTKITQTRTPNNSGGLNLAVMIDDVVGDRIASGESRINHALEGRYGLDRTRGSY